MRQWCVMPSTSPTLVVNCTSMEDPMKYMMDASRTIGG